MKTEEIVKKMFSKEMTEDDLFNYLEDSLVEEDGCSREEARYAIKLFRDPEFCKKETGYTRDELYLITHDKLTPEQARYVIEHPCIRGPREECDYYRENKDCGGCTNINGFLFLRLGSEEKQKPVKETWDELKKKPTMFVFTSQ